MVTEAFKAYSLRGTSAQAVAETKEDTEKHRCTSGRITASSSASRTLLEKGRCRQGVYDRYLEEDI